jgi:hypothetical protein
MDANFLELVKALARTRFHDGWYRSPSFPSAKQTCWYRIATESQIDLDVRGHILDAWCRPKSSKFTRKFSGTLGFVFFQKFSFKVW